MKIASLTLDGVLGAPDGTYSFLDKDGRSAPVVLLRGDEGSGKTAILRAIAAMKEHVGAYGAPPRPSALLKRGRSSGRITATWILGDAERRLGGLEAAEHHSELVLSDAMVQPLVDAGLRKVFANADAVPGAGGLEMIPAARQLVPGAELLPAPVELARRARDDADKYAGLAGWLVERATADGAAALQAVAEKGLVAAWDRPDSLAGVRAAIQSLVPSLRLRGIESRNGTHRVLVDRADGSALDLFELSSSERDAVLLAMIVHQRRLDHSLVLLDEPTSTVAANRRAARFRGFTELASDMQVIAASSATELVGAAPRQLDIDLSPGGRR